MPYRRSDVHEDPDQGSQRHRDRCPAGLRQREDRARPQAPAAAQDRRGDAGRARAQGREEPQHPGAVHSGSDGVHARGSPGRAREASTDMYAAIDLVTDKLTRRVKKYHDKMHGKTRHGHDKPAVEVEPAPALAPVAGAAALADELAGETAHAGDNGRIVKTKQFALKPMTVNEATLQLELVGHAFFVFTNAESNR